MPQNSGSFQDDAILYNTRIKIFPHQIKISCFTKQIFNPDKVSCESKPKCIAQEEREEQQALWLEQVRQAGNEQYIQAQQDIERLSNLEREKKRIRRDSMKRTRDKAYEIANANEWDYFITMTLDSREIDRSDKDEILRRVGQWLKDMVRRHDFVFLIFPEYHKKDNAVHFHGLCKGNLNLVLSDHNTASNQPIYYWLNWPFGFTTVVKLTGHKERIVNYVMKYITKEEKKVFGKAYFAGGKGLKREVPTQYENLSFEDFEGKEYQIPETGIRVKYQTITLQGGNENDIYSCDPC